MGDVAYGANKFVAKGINNGEVNDSGHIYTSTLGTTTWTQRSILGGSQISFCNGIFIVPYSAGINLNSSDGINWTTQNTGLTNMLGKVAYASGLFMARAGNHLATSTDGTNWVQYSQNLPGTSGVACDGKRIVTVDKASTGPPLYFYYNSYIYLSDVLVGIRMTNSAPAKVALSGLVGRSYQIQSSDALVADSNNWKTNTTLPLPSTPYVWTDSTATTSQRFYRAVLLP